ncbi:trypsin-like serine protease [Halobacteriovorax sp. GB3]|uniref:trypsin-like serine peptidase n=1 Tax=Halobacteriovorax sp. GB3 TaxID=2719615 RepID=UPI002362535D|nr:trypsin-like serine protease [Halobacteriovorax sp. GB3]MDD0852125.1 trypsin-like serine protease [Halobacteriovorax sp. GB3]
MKILGLLVFLIMSNSASAIIIRGESRTQVHDPKDARAKKVGLLKMWNNNDSQFSTCTASIISKKHIVTAAHCIINHKTGKRYDNAVYFPRHIDASTRSPSRIFIQEGHVLKTYTKELRKMLFNPNTTLRNINDTMIQNDIAILRAYSDFEQDDVGALYGWYGTKSAPDSLKNEELLDISISSYPGDKKDGTLWHENCYLKGFYNNVGLTNCDVYPGASGSAITIKPEGKKYRQVIGVLSAESKTENKVALFTEEITNEILNIIRGEEHRNILFEKVNFKTKKSFHIYVQNKCHEDIKVAIRIQKEDETWATYERYNISKDERSTEIASSVNSIYYYYAKSQSSSMWWGDNVDGVRKKAFGEYRDFYRKQISRSNENVRWGDHYRQVSCD